VEVRSLHAPMSRQKSVVRGSQLAGESAWQISTARLRVQLLGLSTGSGDPS
jgi:hypothetical protein